MSKKPPPTLPVPPTPAGLSERSVVLWHAVVPARAMSPGRLALIEQALRALDRADQARALVDAAGLVTTTETTGAAHANPCVRIEREARAQFLTAWRDLGLAFDATIDGRLRS